jgi:hypothetical protein
MARGPERFLQVVGVLPRESLEGTH